MGEEINNILKHTLEKLKQEPSTYKSEYVIKSISTLLQEINAEYVYIKYQVSYHNDFEYYKFEKSWFDTISADDIEEHIFSFPEWDWIHDSWRSYSINYQICSSDEYHRNKGF